MTVLLNYDPVREQEWMRKIRERRMYLVLSGKLVTANARGRKRVLVPLDALNFLILNCSLSVRVSPLWDRYWKARKRGFKSTNIECDDLWSLLSSGERDSIE